MESSSVTNWISWEVNSSGIDSPSLVGTIVASIENDMSVVRVGVSVNIKALSWDISDVSVWSSIVGNSLVCLTLPLSDNSSSVDDESLSSLVGDGIVSLQVWSDGSSSRVENEPLSLVPWLVIVDSKSVLVSTDVLMPEEGSSRSHSSSELESVSIFKWLSWP